MYVATYAVNSASHLQVLGNALDGMELEDDSKSLPQVLGSMLFCDYYFSNRLRAPPR